MRKYIDNILFIVGLECTISRCGYLTTFKNMFYKISKIMPITYGQGGEDVEF